MGNRSSSPHESHAYASGEADFVATEDETLTRTHVQRLIIYAEGSDIELQRQVAELLANEAVIPEKRNMIVELGGMQLLLPLAKSRIDTTESVQKLAAHAIANLSVEPANQALIAAQGGIPVLLKLLDECGPNVQRQAAKSLANLAVNTANKIAIREAGGIAVLVRRLGADTSDPVRVEAMAAVANLAVNDDNEAAVGAAGGLPAVVDALQSPSVELRTQAARALRNLSMRPENKSELKELNTVQALRAVAADEHQLAAQQARKALANLEASA